MRVGDARPAVRQAPAAAPLLAAGLIAAVFMSGIINLLPAPAGIAPGSLVIDALVMMMALAAVAETIRCRGRVVVPAWLPAFGLLLATYLALLPHGPEAFPAKLLDLRSQVLYIVAGVAVAIAVPRSSDRRMLVRVAMWSAFASALFGICQFVFRGVLPVWLLHPADADLFGYWGTDIIRSNGLLGNTIVYANVLVLFLALWAAQLAVGFSWRRLAAVCVLFAAVLTTFSRIAIVGAVAICAVLLIPALLRWGVRLRRMNRGAAWGLFGLLPASAALAGLALGAAGAFDRVASTFLIGDLFLNRNPSVQASTAIHNDFIDVAWRILSQSPLVGEGIHSQRADSINARSSVVILDGAAWQVLAEGGLLLFAAFAVLAAAVALALVRLIKATGHFAAAGLLAFWIYEFCAAVFVNSALFGKASFLLMWVLVGAVTAEAASRDRGELHRMLTHRSIQDAPSSS